MIEIGLILVTDDGGNSLSYELGFLTGSNDAAIMGVLETDEIEALGIASWQQTRRSMNLDLQQFVAGFVAGFACYLNGLV